MNIKKIDLHLIKSIVFLSGVFILLPLLRSNQLLDPTQIPRIIGLAAISVLFAMLSFIESFKTSFKRPDISVIKNPIFIILSIYILINALSLFNSINIGEGIAEVLRLTLFLILFYSFCTILTDQRANTKTVLKFINISILIICLIGIIQVFHLARINLLTGVSVSYDQITSSLGNKNIFGSVIVLTLFINLLSISVLEKGWKVFAVFNFILLTSFLLIIQSVAAWIALMVSAILVTIILKYHTHTLRRGRLFFALKTKRFTAYSVLVLLAIISITFFLRPDYSLTKQKILSLRNYVSTPEMIFKSQSLSNDNEIYERTHLAIGTLKMIEDNFYLGAGIGNWKFLIDKYGNKTSFLSNRMLRFQYPENEFLQITSETGVIGLITYLSMFIISIFYAFQLFRRSEVNSEKFLFSLLTVSLISYLILSFFSYPSQRIFPFVLVMIIMSLIISKRSELSGYSQKLSLTVFRSSMIVITLLAGFIVFVGIKKYQGELHLSNALTHQKNENWEGMINELNKTENFFYRADHLATPISWYKGLASYYSGKADLALTHFLNAENINPNHVHVLTDIGALYLRKNEFQNAIGYFQKALDLNDSHREALLNLSIAYYHQGSYEKANDTISLFPDNHHPAYLKYKDLISVALNFDDNSI